MVQRLARLDRFVGVNPDALSRGSDEVAVLERHLEVLSEASRRLPPEMKAAHTGVDWRGLADLGNLIRHGYESVSPSRLLNILDEHLTPLKNALDEIMRQMDAQ